MSVVQLDDVKSYMSITNTTSDVRLQAALDAAEGMIGQRIGSLSATAKTSRVEGGPTLLLPATPVVSVTSITPTNVQGAAAVDLTEIQVDQASGIVWSPTGFYLAPVYVVVYQAGQMGALSPDVALAVMELSRHLFEVQRGPNVNLTVTASDYGPGYAIPRRVLELIAPYMTYGIA